MAVPPGVVTLIVPEELLPAVAVMVESSVTVKADAFVLPKFTAVAPVKLLPLIVTISPTAPSTGLNEVMVGAGTDALAGALIIASTAMPSSNVICARRSCLMLESKPRPHTQTSSMAPARSCPSALERTFAGNHVRNKHKKVYPAMMGKRQCSHRPTVGRPVPVC